MSETSTEIVPESLPALLPVAQDVVVLARTPEEMAESQTGLLTWAEQKVVAERAELAQKEENLAHAKRGKYQTGPWRREVNVAKQRVIQYEKILAAIKAGYYIVPAFPQIDTIAIRTRKVLPPTHQRESNWGQPRVEDLKGQTLPVGQGDYVSPQPVVDRWHEVRVDEKGKEEKYHLVANRAFAAIDFPFHAVKPQILADLNRALQERIFDEIGVLPQRRRKGDPMVIGTIKRRQGYTEHTVNFLISWWIDTRDL